MVDEKRMDLMKCEVLRIVDGPVHVVPDSGVKSIKIFLGDNMICVKVQNMIEEVDEFLLLEGGEIELSFWHFFHIFLSSFNKSTPCMFNPA